MKRREFIATGCVGCLSGGLILSLLESCGSTKMITASIVDSDMVVPLSAFRNKKGYKNYLVLQNDILQYPICVYRNVDGKYEALLMKCTHQGTELQAFGDKLQCPAHGSEFNSHGKVENGPANASLRTFPVTITNDQLLISLK
ncbi:Rieske (2Fe-2S) protein [Flavitalea sp. BT771]|uniref:QcrA and Rieske domain-containing protein n=1 Tax=Flavitalea sp. BT771 TaxID=3063329 RepID=UPI0026E40D80|nr:Rieske (2Fe-2S) protein [Flavitalea sp. BT771]MDO6431954.1 Rieske (2Fe-2S) protein [Flavitalea sp. BT771]MDV6220863.1 Rieske (2Fe-2S) protein [Flavitalea sp. BT771]